MTLGFDPRLSHPRNFIISVLPVLPSCARPYVKADNKMCDDDITINYVEIIKANNNLAEELEDEGVKGNRRNKDNKETNKQRALASLRFRILTTFNNSQGEMYRLSDTQKVLLVCIQQATYPNCGNILLNL